MDRRFICTVLAVLAVTAGAAALVNQNELPGDYPISEIVSGVEEKESSSRSGEDTPSETAYAYVIREFDGHIAVFSASDDANPEIIYDMLVKYLPDYDRQQLQQGVPVQDYRELISRIEDYIS